MLVHLFAYSVYLTVARADSIVAKPSSYINRIIGGSSSDIKTYPYQVSLQKNGYHVCGGSIISKDYVLTAGHCVNPQWPKSSLSIRVGTSYREGGGSIYHVQKVTRHEDYRVSNETPLNDLAVIKVTSPFQFSDAVQPIPLFEIKEVSLNGDKGVATGWGSTGTRTLSRRLQSVTVPIIDKRICSKAYQKRGGLPTGQICAGYYGLGGKDACQGDSGGPLAIGGRLAGIISWGHGCAEPKYPGVFTEIAYYRRWINMHAELY